MTSGPTEADRIEELALECLERVADEGESVVDRVCAGHPELSGRVRGVLRQLQSVGLVAGGAAETAQELGDFRLLKKLGEGGMGVVWLAEQKSLRRRVALKLLRPGFQVHDRLQHRFRREVQALSKLDHPHICTVYEAGEIEGAPYLAMRYVEGESLARLLEERRCAKAAGGATTRATPSRELVELVHLVEKVALALHAAHEAGVVHRDVKPGNVLIDPAGEPVLVDFGLAHDDDPALSVLTVTGEPLGTPAYMAPEQVSGTGPIDRRTDVYALGALLYECATLQTPFTGPSRDSLYSSILHDPVPDPRKKNRTVGRELQAVLERALDKDRRRRFSTAQELAGELGRIRRHEPVRTRPVGPVMRTVRWCQRNRAATVVLAVVTVALVGSVLLLQRSVALLQRSVSAEERLRARALIAAAEGVEQENPELAFKLCREALFVRDDPADVDPLVVAKAQETMFRLRKIEVIHESKENLLYRADFSPDGQFLVVCEGGMPPTLYRSDGSGPRQLLECTTQRPHAFAFSPDSAAIAVADDTGGAHVYDVLGGQQEPSRSLGRDRPARPRGMVARIGWSSAGDHVVALAHDDGEVTIWDRDGRLLKELHPVDGRTVRPWRAAAFLPDGRLVACGAIWSARFDSPLPLLGSDGLSPDLVLEIEHTKTRIIAHAIEATGACMWDHDGRLLYESDRGDESRFLVHDADFAPKGDRFAISFNDGRVELRDAETGRLLDTHWTLKAGCAMRLRFSPDGASLALATTGGLVESWEFGRKPVPPLMRHRGQVRSVAFSPHGDRVLSASWDGTARLLQLGTPRDGVPQFLGGNRPDVAKVRGGIVVATGRDQAILFDDEGNPVRSTSVGAHWVSVQSDPTGTKAIFCSFDGLIHRWDLESAQPAVPIRYAATVPLEQAYDAGMLEDGRILVRTLKPLALYQLIDGRVERIGASLGYLTRLVVSPSGRQFVVGVHDGSWHRFALQGGELALVDSAKPVSSHGVIGLAYSHDEQRLLVGTVDGQLHLWRLEPRKHLRTYRDHQQMVHSVDFSPDDRRMASASLDGTVRVFNEDSPEAALVLRTNPGEGVFRVAFVDERRVVTASSDGTVCWWCLDAVGVRETVEGVAVDELSEEERARFRALLDR